MSRPISARVECLDGLRGLAALWVLMGHCVILAGWSLAIIDKPDLGVDLFMMLSGFFMVFHYQERAKQEPWSEPRTWLKFWTRRYFRISPLYYLALVFALGLGPMILVWRNLIDDFSHLVPYPASIYIDHSFANIALHLTFLFGLLPAYSVHTPLPDWNLGLEMQFYAVFPALMLLTEEIRLGPNGFRDRLPCRRHHACDMASFPSLSDAIISAIQDRYFSCRHADRGKLSSGAEGRLVQPCTGASSRLPAFRGRGLA